MSHAEEVYYESYGKSLIKKIVKIAFALMLMVGVIGVGNYVWDYIRSDRIYDELKQIRAETIETDNKIASIKDQLVKKDDDTQYVSNEDGDGNDTTVTEPVEVVDAVPGYEAYRNIFQLNSDMIAWIYIPNTKIDYPVMQTMDNEIYYLNHDFYKKKNSNGCLIMDTESNVKVANGNLIIHGHHLRNGGMFGDLDKYDSTSYAEKHRKIYLYLENERRTYEVMSAFHSKVYNKDEVAFRYYDYFYAENQAAFDDFYTNIMKLNEIKTDVTAKYGDEFLTLSTCEYHTDDGRFVVVAKRVE